MLIVIELPEIACVRGCRILCAEDIKKEKLEEEERRKMNARGLQEHILQLEQARADEWEQNLATCPVTIDSSRISLKWQCNRNTDTDSDTGKARQRKARQGETRDMI